MAEEFTIGPDLAGERIDVALSRLMLISRTKAADLITAGNVTVDGKRPSRSDRCNHDAHITVEDSVPIPIAEPEAVVGMEIVVEDPQFVVINKPPGVAAHASPGWTGPTVGRGLAAMGISLAQAGAAEREGIVHRLDVGTSGVMVVARTDSAYSSLKQQFKDRTVDKHYRALVQGHPDPSRGTIDAPIGRHPNADYKFAVVADGRNAITHYEINEAFRSCALVDIQLETGRTHQIRVHMAAVRHPCCGDIQYGADPTLATKLGLTRQWLHAHTLAFDNPMTGERVTASAPYFPDLQIALERAQT